MTRKILAALAMASLTLAACGLRGDPAVPPLKGQASPPPAPADTSPQKQKP